MHLNHWEIDDDLVYMYSETRDEKSEGTFGFDLNNVRFDDLPLSEYTTCVKRLFIPNYNQKRLMNCLNIKANNPRFTLIRTESEITIIIHLENEYLKSNIHLIYDVDTDEFTRPVSIRDYSKLQSMKWFQDEVKRVEREIGLEVFTYNYGFDRLFKNDILTIENDFKVVLSFGDGDYLSDYPEYKVNFDERKLEFYHLAPGHEVFVGIL